MAIAKVNDTPAENIGKANSVPIANVAKFGEVEAPVGGQTATRWVAAHDGNGQDWYISYASHSDRSSWSGTTVIDGDDPDTYWLAYGKISGNNVWAAVTSSNNIEIAVDGNNDVTDGSTWSKISKDSSNEDLQKCRTIAWGNDVWIAMGHMASGHRELYRSTDAASWAEIDLSSVVGNATQTVYGLAYGGGSLFVFGQHNKLFGSVDSGATWAEISSYPGAVVCDVGVTNNTLVVLDAGTPGQINTAAISAIETELNGGSNSAWGTQELTDSSNQSITTGTSGNTRSTMACGAGVAIVAHTTNTMALDVDGTTVSVRASGKVAVGSNNVISNSINTIATDGNGVWLVGSDGSGGGDVAQSTDNGANWTQIVDGFNYEGDRKFEAIRANVHLPV